MKGGPIANQRNHLQFNSGSVFRRLATNANVLRFRVVRIEAGGKAERLAHDPRFGQLLVSRIAYDAHKPLDTN